MGWWPSFNQALDVQKRFQAAGDVVEEEGAGSRCCELDRERQSVEAPRTSMAAAMADQ